MAETLQKPISREEILDLKIPFKRVLPTNYISIIAERSGFSENWVIKVLSGQENPNAKIINTAFQLIDEMQELRAEFQRQFTWEG